MPLYLECVCPCPHAWSACVHVPVCVQGAIDQLVKDADGLQRLAAGVQGSSSKARITCLEVTPTATPTPTPTLTLTLNPGLTLTQQQP